MPGVESFDVHDDKRWTANVKIPLGLGGLKMKIDMNTTEERELEYGGDADQGPGRRCNDEHGHDIRAQRCSRGGTAMQWSADVKIAGPVGSMGQRVLQPIVNQQVQCSARSTSR
jgi:carbon monoxide dehydrogenase subunit G